MGVKTMWSILSSSGEMLDLRELQGNRVNYENIKKIDFIYFIEVFHLSLKNEKQVAIDLAGWIVQNNTCKGMYGVSRPHLRNLFFRVASLISLNIQPIFVLDGDAPDLKKETLVIRQKAASSQSQALPNEENKSCSRRRLKGLMNECKALLDSLGIESVKAEGEAEALCARLNAEGLVDAVISDDSDAFCYGAHVLLRNFSISSGGACVERYIIDKISHSLKLDRSRIIMMAVLLGCDFCPAGVPGVGKESILQIFEMWPEEWDAIGAFKYWIQKKFGPVVQTGCSKAKKANAQYQCYTCNGNDGLNHCQECDEWSLAVNSWSSSCCHCQLLASQKNLFKLEESLKRKCAEVDFGSFWNKKFGQILEEFLQSKCKAQLPAAATNDLQVKCPNVDGFIALAVKKLAWTEDYALEKILPLLSRWHVQNKSNCQSVIRPREILKQRIISGTASFVVRWEWIDSRPTLAPEKFETTEPTVYLEKFCPALIETFLEAKKSKTKSKGTKKSKKATTDLQKPITQFFREQKVRQRLPSPKLPKEKVEELSKDKQEEEEDLPDNLSFLIDDILSHKMKRNLSLVEPSEVLTSTPVNHGPRKKRYDGETKKTIKNVLEDDHDDEDDEDLQDSFDKMCNVRQHLALN